MKRGQRKEKKPRAWTEYGGNCARDLLIGQSQTPLRRLSKPFGGSDNPLSYLNSRHETSMLRMYGDTIMIFIRISSSDLVPEYS